MKNKLKPIKSFIQLKTLYQNDDYMVTKDKMDSYTLFSRKGGIWDAYYLKDYNKFYNDEIMDDYQNYGYTEKPVYILVKRNTYKWITFDYENELTGKDPYNSEGINVFEEFEEKIVEFDSYSYLGGALLNE